MYINQDVGILIPDAIFINVISKFPAGKWCIVACFVINETFGEFCVNLLNSLLTIFRLPKTKKIKKTFLLFFLREPNLLSDITNMTPSEDHYSQVKIEEIIENITDADISRLISLFKNMGCENRIGWDELELLSQVIQHVLDGNRTWPKYVNTITFLKNTGRSLIDNEKKKRKILDNSVEIDEFHESSSPNNSTEILAINSSAQPDQTIELEENDSTNKLLYEKIVSLFKDNKSILCILKQKLEGVKKVMIIEICSITEDTYTSSMNKIKYQLKKLYPSGYEHEFKS